MNSFSLAEHKALQPLILYAFVSLGRFVAPNNYSLIVQLCIMKETRAFLPLFCEDEFGFPRMPRLFYVAVAVPLAVQ